MISQEAQFFIDQEILTLEEVEKATLGQAETEKEKELNADILTLISTYKLLKPIILELSKEPTTFKLAKIAFGLDLDAFYSLNPILNLNKISLFIDFSLRRLTKNQPKLETITCWLEWKHITLLLHEKIRTIIKNQKTALDEALEKFLSADWDNFNLFFKAPEIIEGIWEKNEIFDALAELDSEHRFQLKFFSEHPKIYESIRNSKISLAKPLSLQQLFELLAKMPKEILDSEECKNFFQESIYQELPGPRPHSSENPNFKLLLKYKEIRDLILLQEKPSLALYQFLYSKASDFKDNCNLEQMLNRIKSFSASNSKPDEKQKYIPSFTMERNSRPLSLKFSKPIQFGQETITSEEAEEIKKTIAEEPTDKAKEETKVSIEKTLDLEEAQFSSLHLLDDSYGAKFIEALWGADAPLHLANLALTFNQRQNLNRLICYKEISLFLIEQVKAQKGSPNEAFHTALSPLLNLTWEQISNFRNNFFLFEHPNGKKFREALWRSGALPCLANLTLNKDQNHNFKCLIEFIDYKLIVEQGNPKEVFDLLLNLVLKQPNNVISFLNTEKLTEYLCKEIENKTPDNHGSNNSQKDPSFFGSNSSNVKNEPSKIELSSFSSLPPKNKNNNKF